MKVALILSPFDQMAAAGFTTKIVKRIYGFYMPLGIASLASVLEQAGHIARVLDPCPQKLSLEKIVEWIKKENPDVLGISALTHASKNGYKLTDMLKKELPNLPVIMGGTHCTAFPEKALEDCPSLDAAVIGEAEERIVPIVEALYNKSGLDKIKGVLFRDPASGQVINTGAPDIQLNLSKFPFAARHLFNNDLYVPFPDQMKKNPVTNIMTSRGCTWRKCQFCFEGGKYMPLYRRRTPESVIAELREIKKMGFEAVVFWDDNFCVSEDWVGKFCELLKQEKLDLSWSCNGRVDTLSETMVKKIKDAGCFTVYIGFESGNQETLNKIQKGTTLLQARQAVKNCREAGIEVRGSFIIGFPWETPELAKESIEFAKELDLAFVKFMLFTPEYGTGLYDVAKNSGAFINSEMHHGSLSQAAYLPNGFKSVEQLEKIAQRANLQYVFRPRFLIRKILSIRSWQDVRKYFDGFLMMISLRRSS